MSSLGGGVPFVGAEEATRFQAGGTVRAGQEYGAVALGVLFADDCCDDGEELVALRCAARTTAARVPCRCAEHQLVQVRLLAADGDDDDERRAQFVGG